MAISSFGRVQRASALLPLAVLSVAWTASLATTRSDASAASDSGQLPGGARVPSQAIKAPASLSSPGKLAPGLQGRPHRAVRLASATGIPAVALAAYQRAQTVIDSADRSCHLPWQLLAAIGRVESDHGRAEGNHLTNKGIDQPGVYGPELDGRNGTALIRDTDAGQYDHDAKYDRAVGPMQFIPSTWAIVGVDADNDGQRNPQDIYDASLASAVYLCAGPGDLATSAGQRSAVLRYNHSEHYAALVLAIANAYLAGDYAAVPNGTTTTGFSFGTPPLSSATHRPSARRRLHHGHGRHQPVENPSMVPSSEPTSVPSSVPTTAPSTAPTHTPTSNSTSKPPLPLPSLTLPSVTLPSVTPPPVLTKAEAIAKCLAKGLIDNPLDPHDAFDKCVYKLTH